MPEHFAVCAALSTLLPTRSFAHPQTKESKSFWKAMMKVHEKLTDINQIKAHNQIKETKLKVGGQMHSACAWPALPGMMESRADQKQAVAPVCLNTGLLSLPCRPLPPTCSSPGSPPTSSLPRSSTSCRR